MWSQEVEDSSARRAEEEGGGEVSRLGRGEVEVVRVRAEVKREAKEGLFKVK